jgi:hypothetical protein
MRKSVDRRRRQVRGFWAKVVMARTAANKVLLEAGVIMASKTAGIKETF